MARVGRTVGLFVPKPTSGWAARTVPGLTCEAPSAGVRWCPAAHATIVTHLGTRSPGRPRQHDHLIRSDLRARPLLAPTSVDLLGRRSTVRDDCRRYAALCGQNPASVAGWPSRLGRPRTVKPQLTPNVGSGLPVPKLISDSGCQRLGPLDVVLGALASLFPQAVDNERRDRLSGRVSPADAKRMPGRVCVDLVALGRIEIRGWVGAVGRRARSSLRARLAVVDVEVEMHLLGVPCGRSGGTWFGASS
jgi:hypothetical protein